MVSAKITLAVLFAVLPAFAYHPGFGLGFERLARRAVNSTGEGTSSDSNSTQWPAPLADGGKAWAAAFAKAKAAVAEMTVEELVNVTTGVVGLCSGQTGAVTRLGIPQLCLQDGPIGPRGVYGSSQFPAGITVAATWDRELMYARARAMGQEFHDQGIHVALAPVTGGPLGRTPLDGRGWEGTFADPYACGEASYLSVKGITDAGVATVAKHWIAYEQETSRNIYLEYEGVSQADVQLPISSNVDDLTMHEVYMWSFAEAVRAGTSHIMCSYNRINNTQSCSSAKGLNNLLKTELNFQGGVVSDWGGQWDSVASAENGLDVSMPGAGFLGELGDFWGSTLVDLINNGTVSEVVVQDKVIRFFTAYYHLGQDIDPLPTFVYNTIGSPTLNATSGYRNVRKPSSAELIKEIGSASVTLLKNTGSLPLKHPQRIAVLGNDATDNVLGPNACGLGNSACDITNLNGTLSTGGGSGSALAPYIITPLDALQKRAIEDNAEIAAVVANSTTTIGAEDAIASLLPDADVTLVFLNRYSGEGADIPDFELAGDGDNLMDLAVTYSSNVVVVIHTTGVVNIEKWVDNPNVTAILVAYLPGQEAGSSLVPVLYGDVAPSGKLPFTWGKSTDDYPPNGVAYTDAYSPQANFTEGVLIDYRWFDQKGITPRYEFGFGLSYTTFSYSDLIVDQGRWAEDYSSVMDTAEPFAGWDGSNSLYDVLFTVFATVTNTGNVTGSEVAQLYISIPGDNQPVRQLRGFDKAKDLAAGDSAVVSFPVRRKDVSSWSVVGQYWFVPQGTFGISVGGSSRNLPLNITWTP
ncbi:beta-D-xylosidase/beta-D-glucosidase [Lentinula aciculospora]|uniref:Probable beta-glucosidase G n=1 Tax=Lentinula aciculospora TaxID=153920 RepID=A0A9W9AFV2_9AGAR|nr:beta-D-xylosidase/beta-D-glucosidase [Lentinula aciculospora]